MYLVNFATLGTYKEVQLKQRELLHSYVQDILEFDPEVLKNFYMYNQRTIDNSLTGWGYCSWKPYIILSAFASTPPNSLIFYSDVADEIYNPDFWSWAERRTTALSGHFFNLNYHIHKEWTKRDCFVVMGCDNRKYWEHRQLEAGTIILQNNQENKRFLEQWLFWCENPIALDKSPNKLGKENLPGFRDHRTDQSILTNLVIMKDWETEYMENVKDYIHYNAFDNQLSPDKHLHG